MKLWIKRWLATETFDCGRFPARQCVNMEEIASFVRYSCCTVIICLSFWSSFSTPFDLQLKDGKVNSACQHNKSHQFRFQSSVDGGLVHEESYSSPTPQHLLRVIADMVASGSPEHSVPTRMQALVMCFGCADTDSFLCQLPCAGGWKRSVDSCHSAWLQLCLCL